LDLEVDPVSGKVTHFEGTLLPVDESVPPDAHTVAAVEAEQARAREIMSRVVGTLSQPFDLADNCECAVGDLLADALLERVKGTEIALALAGHWETGLESGALTQGQLFAANRSTANPAKVELTGEQILQFLRAALKPGNAAQAPHSLRGRKMGLPHVAGLTIRYDPSNLETIEVRVGSQPLQGDQKYVVAATDMEFSDIYGYLVIPDEQVEYEVPTIMPEVLEEYIAHHSPIAPAALGRIRTF
jgi:5'-nucleotidase